MFSTDPKTGLQEAPGQLVFVCFCLYSKRVQQSQVFQCQEIQIKCLRVCNCCIMLHDNVYVKPPSIERKQCNMYGG